MIINYICDVYSQRMHALNFITPFFKFDVCDMVAKDFTKQFIVSHLFFYNEK